MLQPRKKGIEIKSNGVREALQEALDVDVSEMVDPVIDLAEAQGVIMLDLDRPALDHDPTIPLYEQDRLDDIHPALEDGVVERLFPDWLPRPLYVWRSPNSGLRTILVDADGWLAAALAGCWHLLAPLDDIAAWPVEVVKTTRHPKSTKDGKSCGPVVEFKPTGHASIPGGDALSATPESIDSYLSDTGLQRGLNNHDLCPFDPGPSRKANVSVDQERGIYCFKCGRGASWARLICRVDVHAPSIYLAAKQLVHFQHAQHLLEHRRPTTPTKLLAPAWDLIVRMANEDRLKKDDDGKYLNEKMAKRVEKAASAFKSPDIVRLLSGGWADSRTLEVRNVIKERTINAMPWAMGGPRIDEAMDTLLLKGFTPLYPVPHLLVTAPEEQAPPGSILVRAPARPGDPPSVDLGSRPPEKTAVERAWVIINHKDRFPGIPRGYLQATILAALVGRMALGQPPILLVSGPSHSAKTTTPLIASVMLGTEVSELKLRADDVMMRNIGIGLMAGSTIFLGDEICYGDDTYRQLRTILRLRETATFCRKYKNEERMPMRACLVFASTELPQTFTLSSELANRAVGYELFDRCEWGRPNISRLRHDDKLRAALDLITSSVWWRLAAEGPGIDWRQYAMEHFGAHDIGLTERDDDVLRGRVEVLRKLYQYFRTAQPSEFATDDEAYKTYLDASQAREPGKILGQLIDMTADRKAQTPQINELKKTRLEPILGFDEPKIRLRIQRRGPRYLVKFSLANKSKKIARENLPELRQLPSEHQEPGAETF